MPSGYGQSPDYVGPPP